MLCCRHRSRHASHAATTPMSATYAYESVPTNFQVNAW
jgi:hypothetical protein